MMFAQTGAGIGFIIIFVAVVAVSCLVKLPTARGRARHERKMRDDAGYRHRFYKDQADWPGQTEYRYPPDPDLSGYFPPLPGEETPEQRLETWVDAHDRHTPSSS